MRSSFPQLADEPLDGAVGLVHDRVEGVLHDSRPLFRQDDFFLLPGPVVIKLHPYIVRVPLLHLAHPHRADLCLPRHRVLVNVHRNDGNDPFVQQGEIDVVPQSPARLVLVGRQVQTRIKARVQHRIEAVVFVEPYVVYGDSCGVLRHPGVNCRQDGAVGRPVQPWPVWPVAVAPSVHPGRVPVQKCVPGVFQPGAK